MMRSDVLSASLILGCVLGACDAPETQEGLAFRGAALGASGTITGIGGKCIDVRGGNPADGTIAQLWDCNESPQQAWTYDGTRIVGLAGKCLDARGGSSANGTRVQLWTCNGSPAQAWTLDRGQLRGPGGKCLDASGASDANGTPLVLWDCWGGANQQWQVNASQTQGVALSWASPAPGSAVSGSVALGLTGHGLVNVEIFRAGAMLVRCQVSPDGTKATATLDASQLGSGAVTLTAHAWNSPAGTPYTADADAGSLTITVGSGTGATSGPAGPVMRARDLLDTLGVNTHIDFTFIAVYQSRQRVIDGVNYLGVKHLRDDPSNPADVGAGGWWQEVANGTGAKFDAFLGEGSPATVQGDLERVKQLAPQGILDFVEGGNEEDDAYAIQQGNTLAWTASFQPTVYQTAKSLGLPTINMSFGAGWTAANQWHGDYDKVGDLSGACDFANAHTYPAGAPQVTIQQLDDDAHLAAPSRPVIATEFGYDTGSTDPTSAAKWSLDAVFDGLKLGDVKTYFYALFDDGSGAFGLLHDDGSPKPAGLALHDLTTLLADPAPNAATFTSTALDYTVSGTADSWLVQKADGTWWLALWNEAAGAAAVTISFGAPKSRVQVFDPLTGTAAVKVATNTTSIAVSVPDHPILVSIAR